MLFNSFGFFFKGFIKTALVLSSYRESLTSFPRKGEKN